MSKSESLHLYEELLLLALRDREGTIASGAWAQQALGGALLAELVLEGRVSVRGDGKEVVVARRTPLGDELLDESLDTIAASNRARGLSHWVSKLADTKELKHRAARSLCRRGILKADTDKLLLLFERRIYPELDPAPERALVERLRHAIFDSDEADLDPRTCALVSLAHATGILGLVFGRKELKPHKARIEGIQRGQAIGKATREVVDTLQTVILVAALMPAILG